MVIRCWRCGRLEGHKPWCSMPGGCTHCGWSPCRWWCTGERVVLNDEMPAWSDHPAYQRERYRRITAGEWVFR